MGPPSSVLRAMQMVASKNAGGGSAARVGPEWGRSSAIVEDQVSAERWSGRSSAVVEDQASPGRQPGGHGRGKQLRLVEENYSEVSEQQKKHRKGSKKSSPPREGGSSLQDGSGTGEGVLGVEDPEREEGDVDKDEEEEALYPAVNVWSQDVVRVSEHIDQIAALCYTEEDFQHLKGFREEENFYRCLRCSLRDISSMRYAREVMIPARRKLTSDLKDALGTIWRLNSDKEEGQKLLSEAQASDSASRGRLRRFVWIWHPVQRNLRMFVAHMIGLLRIETVRRQRLRVYVLGWLNYKKGRKKLWLRTPR